MFPCRHIYIYLYIGRSIHIIMLVCLRMCVHLHVHPPHLVVAHRAVGKLHMTINLLLETITTLHVDIPGGARPCCRVNIDTYKYYNNILSRMIMHLGLRVNPFVDVPLYTYLYLYIGRSIYIVMILCTCTSILRISSSLIVP